MYFSCRQLSKNLSPPLISQIKHLPLFETIKSSANDEYVSIGNDRLRYVSLNGANVHNLSLLSIPGFLFLGWPLEDFSLSYKRLDVELMSSIQFIAKDPLPHSRHFD